MKLPTLSTTFIATMVALSASVSADNTCIRQDNALYTYIVKAADADGAEGTCNGLWDNLKPFPSCVASKKDCNDEDGKIEWSFDVGKGCDGGSVESAWSEATGNKFGGIDCH